MADDVRVLLHYGGQTFKLPADQADALNEIGDGTGSLKLNLGGGKWLTIVVGPGISIALEVVPKSPGTRPAAFVS